MPVPSASARSRDRCLRVVGCHHSGTTLITALIGNCFRIDGRAEHEWSLWDPIPPVEGIHPTKAPPDTLRIKRTFLLDPELYPQMADWLIRLGYEPDSAWTEELAAVEPYFGRYRNRPPPPLRRFEAWLRYNFKMLAYLWRRREWQR